MGGNKQYGTYMNPAYDGAHSPMSVVIIPGQQFGISPMASRQRQLRPQTAGGNIGGKAGVVRPQSAAQNPTAAAKHAAMARQRTIEEQVKLGNYTRRALSVRPPVETTDTYKYLKYVPQDVETTEEDLKQQAAALDSIIQKFLNSLPKGFKDNYTRFDRELRAANVPIKLLIEVWKRMMDKVCNEIVGEIGMQHAMKAAEEAKRVMQRLDRGALMLAHNPLFDHAEAAPKNPYHAPEYNMAKGYKVEVPR